MEFNVLEDFDFSEKRVVLRVGMDVPIDEDGNITNDKRILEGLSTIKYLLQENAKQIIILNHIGRPTSKEKSLNHDNLAKRLSEYLKINVKKLDDCINIKIPNDKIVLLENLRFHKEEIENNYDFAEELASYGEIYINDAFSVSHREQASVCAITKFIPSFPGLLFEKEVNMLKGLFENPEHPFILILGGKKFSERSEILDNMISKVDKVLLGSSSIFEEKIVNNKIIYPKDFIKENNIALDIGKGAISNYKEELKNAKTILWNGPLGLFEKEEFSRGSNEIIRFISNLNCKKIILGGDTSYAVEKLKLENKFTYISTGGGASLEFLSGKILPGIKALEHNSLPKGLKECS